MDRRKLFNLALIVCSSLVLMAALVALSQAAPTMAATRVTTLNEVGSSPDLESISTLPGGPGLTLPPSLPREAPMLQESPVLTITKSADPNPVNAGGVLTYTIVVINGSEFDATGVVITDELDSEVHFADASDGGSHNSGVVTWNVAEIEIGQTITRALWVTVTDVASGTVLSNTAWVTPTDGISNSDTITTTVTTAADLQIVKSASADPAVAGTSFTYAIAVSNNGPSTASGVTVIDDLPLGLTFDADGSSPECLAAGQSVTCDIGELLAGEEVALTIAVSVDSALADGLTLTNTASASGNESDPIAENNSAQHRTTINRQADLQVAKSASADPVRVGTAFTYSITVTNKGPSVASGVLVSDALPGGLDFDAANSSPECSASGQDVMCMVNALSVNNQMTLAIAVTVDTSLEDGLVLSNTVSVSANEPDPSESDNSATEEILVERIKIFLPLLLKPAPTELTVFNDNTGDDVTFVVRGTSVSCIVPNNSRQFCGTFHPGTYRILVTSACGDGSFTKTYDSGPVTTRVFCR